MNKKRLLLSSLILLTSSLCLFYFLLKNGDYFYIPVSFSEFPNKPLVTVNIEKQPFKLLLDTGSCLPLSAQSRVLNQLINKTLKGQNSLRNIKGKIQQLPEFSIDSIYLNSLPISNITISQETGELESVGGVIWDPTNQHKIRVLKYVDGSIGWPILKRYYCLFDLSQKAIFLSQNSESLKPEYSMRFKKWVCTPFQSGQFGIIVKIQTDWGVKRFVLDTGSTHSMLRGTQEIDPSNKIIFTETQTFLLEGANFGKWKFVTLPIAEQAQDIDGILGIDFFLSHIIFVDPFQQTISISFPNT